MSDAFTVRRAGLGDATAMQAIYSPFCSQSCVSFEIRPPSVAELRGRIESSQHHFPWLALESGGIVLGYAYGAEHMSRAAYRWSCNTSIYLHPRAAGKGNGRLLYDTLLRVLRRQGFVNAYGGITLPNPASVRLHESQGFVLFAVYENVGWKLGRWHDVGWWHKQLLDPTTDSQPAEPLAVADVIGEVLSQ